MVGFSAVQHGVVQNFLGQLTKAGIYDEQIRWVSIDPECHLARGMVATLMCHELVQVKNLKPHSGTTVIAQDLYVTLVPEGEPMAALPGAIRVSRSHGERSEWKDISLPSGVWVELYDGWEARVRPRGTISVRRTPVRGVWTFILLGWEALFTEDNSFQLRPSPN